MSREPADSRAKRRSFSIASIVTLVFVVGGALWILLTDALLYQLVVDRAMMRQLETAKGWLFILMSAVLVYWVTRHAVRKLAQSEATTRAVVDSIADGVFIVGRDRRIIEVNPAATRMLGVEDGRALLGMSPVEFTRRFHLTLPDGRLVNPEQFITQRALRGDEPPSYKAMLHPPGRPEVVIICSAAPVRAFPSGPVAASVSVLHDVTAIESLERLRDEFFSSAAHALKTPVTIIKAHVHLLASSRPSLDRSSAAIERQCGRIDRMTENILVLARLRSGSLRLRPSAVDAGAIVTAVCDEMKATSADHGLVHYVNAWPMVFVDRDRLAQMVRNLIEVAFRRSLSRTNVVLALDERDGCAFVRVTYEPLADPDSDESIDDGFGALRLEEHVNECLVEASYGMVRTEQVGRASRSDWIELPTMENPADA